MKEKTEQSRENLLEVAMPAQGHIWAFYQVPLSLTSNIPRGSKS